MSHHRTCGEHCDCAHFDVEKPSAGRFAVFGDDTEFSRRCVELCEQYGFDRVDDPREALFAIAPLLTKKISPELWAAPELGTLIFHPSALPYRRGPDAIRHTIAAGERVSAVTWFWCDHGLDTGPVCVQELVVLAPGESPGRAYHGRFCPAGLRALERVLGQIKAGTVERRIQDPSLATYDPRWPRDGAGPTNPVGTPKTSHEPEAPPLGALVQAAVFGSDELDGPHPAEELVRAMR